MSVRFLKTRRNDYLVRTDDVNVDVETLMGIDGAGITNSLRF